MFCPVLSYICTRKRTERITKERTYETEKGYSISFVDLLFDDERVTTSPFTIRVKIPGGKQVESVRLLPEGQELLFDVTDGVLTFKTPETELFGMIEVTLDNII